MSDDLKTRLRWAADSSDGCGEWNCDPADLYAAADRIEELEAKLAKAMEALELYSCDDGCNDCPEHERDLVTCGWTASIALAAIKENDNG